MALKENYVDEILATGKTHREYDIVNANGGTIESNIHLVRKDKPQQEGDDYGSLEINELNKMVNATKTTIDNLEVGGRNILMGMSVDGLNLSDSGYRDVTKRERGKFTTLLPSNANCYGFVQYAFSIPVTDFVNFVGKSFSFSIELKINGTFRGLSTGIDVRNGTDLRNPLDIIIDIDDDYPRDKWFRVSGTSVMKVSPTGKTPQSLLKFTWGSSIVGSSIEYRLAKFEIGNMATDWSPAPEDMMQNLAVYNMLQGSKDFTMGKGSTATVEKEKYEGFTVISATAPSGSYTVIAEWGDFATLKPNTYYTISFYAKGEGKFKTYLHPNVVSYGVSSQGGTTSSSDGSIEITPTTSWQRYWVTYLTLPSISGLKSIQPMRSIGTKGYICGCMFTEGAVPYEWKPSIDDVYNEDIQILGTMNLNNFGTDGYRAIGVQTLDLNARLTRNYPIERAGLLVCDKKEKYSYQMYHVRNDVNDIWIRTQRTDELWSPWKKLATEKDIEKCLKLSGGTMTSNILFGNEIGIMTKLIGFSDQYVLYMSTSGEFKIGSPLAPMSIRSNEVPQWESAQGRYRLATEDFVQTRMVKIVMDITWAAGSPQLTRSFYLPEGWSEATTYVVTVSSFDLGANGQAYGTVNAPGGRATWWVTLSDRYPCSLELIRTNASSAGTVKYTIILGKIG